MSILARQLGNVLLVRSTSAPVLEDGLEILRMVRRAREAVRATARRGEPPPHVLMVSVIAPDATPPSSEMVARMGEVFDGAPRELPDYLAIVPEMHGLAYARVVATLSAWVALAPMPTRIFDSVTAALRAVPFGLALPPAELVRQARDAGLILATRGLDAPSGP